MNNKKFIPIIIVVAVTGLIGGYTVLGETSDVQTNYWKNVDISKMSCDEIRDNGEKIAHDVFEGHEKIAHDVFEGHEKIVERYATEWNKQSCVQSTN